jgi:type II secretory pathway pseudopilin PulG
MNRLILEKVSKKNQQAATNGEGFTVIEVIIAASIMVILCVGTLTAFSYVANVNRGENIRAQALSVLQLEVEYYRSLKFVPGLETSADLSTHRNADLQAGVYTHQRVSADGRTFAVTTTVTNTSFKTGYNDEAHCLFKEIQMVAVPQSTESGWLANLQANVTIQRVRSN